MIPRCVVSTGDDRSSTGAQQIDDLEKRGIQYAVASGSLETRVEVLAKYLTHPLNPALR